MAYTTAEINQAVSLLTQQIKGLTPAAARVWVTSEQGDNNNVLGVTYNVNGQQRLYIYSTLAQGVQAAVNLFNSKAYAPARAAVAATSDPAAQLAAIASSGWNDAYYSSPSSGFPQAIGSSGGGTFAPAATSTPAPFINIPEGKILTGADVVYIQDVYSATGIFNSPWGLIANLKLAGILDGYVGQPWNNATRAAIQAQIFGSGAAAGSLGTDIVRNAAGAAGTVAGAAGSAAGAAAGAAFGNFAWVPGMAVNVAILGVILVLGYKGVDQLMGSA